MVYDVIVIGGGCSGLMCCSSINKSLKVLLLESTNNIGNKIRISGKGKCNFTNISEDEEFYKNFFEKEKFVKKVMSKFNNKDILNFFNNNGINYVVHEDGKVFPKSYDSNDIVNMFHNLLKKNNVVINYNSKVIDIKPDNDIYTIITKDNKYQSKNVVLATGGKSYPTTGSTGSGYKLLKNLDLKFVNVRQGLCHIYLKDYNYTNLSGISIKNISMHIYRNNKKIYETMGDILFAHSFLSGPIIRDNARNININDEIYFNFINEEYEVSNDKILRYIEKNSKKLIKTMIKDIYNLPINLISNIIFSCNLSSTTTSELTKIDRKKLISMLVSNKHLVSNLGDINYAHVCKGGLSTKEVNSSLEIKKHPRIFVSGELLDVDAKSGGYNISFALSSAKRVAESINTSMKCID